LGKKEEKKMNNYLCFLLIALCSLFVLIQAQSFNAQVTGHIPNGRGSNPRYMTMKGDLRYDYSNQQQMRIIWDISKYYGANAKVYSYVKRIALAGGNFQVISYTVCPLYNKCSAQTVTNDGIPEFFKATRHSVSVSYTTLPFGSASCSTCYSDPAGGNSIIKTKTVCTNGANTCYVAFFDGTVYTFSGHSAYTTFGTIPETSLTGVGSCPAPVCTPDLDMLLVVDNSGSLDSGEYASVETFCNNIVDSFTLYTTSTLRGLRVAVLQFGDTFYSYDWSYSRATIRSNLQRKDVGGSTATGTALTRSRQMWLKQSPYTGYTPRIGVTKIQIVLTDGYCNVNCGVIVSESTTLDNNNIDVYGIGVGSGVNNVEIQRIACHCASGCACSRAFNVAQFSQLNSLLQSIVSVSCGEVTSICSCSSSFCACERCICASDCHDGTNRCVDSVCNKFASLDVCAYSDNSTLCNADKCRQKHCEPTAAPSGSACIDDGPTNCNDGNSCRKDLCNSATGCYTVDDSINYCITQGVAPNACQNVNCVSPGTCSHVNIDNCNNCRLPCGCGVSGGPACTGTVDCSSFNDFPNCKVGYCDAAIPCDNTVPIDQFAVCRNKDIVCPFVPCFVGTCNVSSPTGTCGYAPKNCNDNNPCTDDLCAGDVCTNPGKNITVFCDDGNPCTIDLCSPTTGCYHEPVDCSMFDNACYHGVCNERNGECFNETIDCGRDLQNRGISIGECHEVKCSLTSRIGDKVIDGKVVPNQVLPPGCYTSYIEVKDTSTCTSIVVGNETVLDCSNAKIITEDACGVCGGNGKSCGLNAAEIAGIAAGVLAAIIIAVIIAVAILGSIAGKVGMDYYKKYKGNMGASHSNPLYDGKEGEHQNPFYEADAAPK